MDGGKGLPASSDPQGGPSRLLLVSNRGPIEHLIDESGNIRRNETCGGVATALAATAQSIPVTWISCAASDGDRSLAADGASIALPGGSTLRYVGAPPDAYRLSYWTFCNPILWFLQHELWDSLTRPDVEQQALDAWERGYVPVNRAVANAIVETLRREGSLPVMLHDYHFYLAPQFVRERVPGAVLQQFIHIPWPRPQVWSRLPGTVVASICRGLLANDSVVFQTGTSVRNFLLTCAAFLPEAQIDAAGGAVLMQGRSTRVWANPISVKIQALQTWVARPECTRYEDELLRETAERTIVRVDRIDPSKNIIVGFQAFDQLLARHPEWIGRVRFLAFLVSSRSAIPEYQRYAEDVLSIIERVNARHRTAAWQPITLHSEPNRARALAGLALYDVLLVNPVLDGMNLISKEGPAVNKRDGVLVLSEGAGSAGELRAGALMVEPDRVEQTAEALHAALAMPAHERRRRAQMLRQAVGRHDFDRWLDRLLADLAAIEEAAPVVIGAR